MTIKNAIANLQRAGQLVFDAQQEFQAAVAKGKAGVANLQEADLIGEGGQRAFDELRALAILVKTLGVVDGELRAVFELATKLGQPVQGQPKRMGRPPRAAAAEAPVNVPKKRGRKPKAIEAIPVAAAEVTPLVSKAGKKPKAKKAVKAIKAAKTAKTTAPVAKAKPAAKKTAVKATRVSKKAAAPAVAMPAPAPAAPAEAAVAA